MDWDRPSRDPRFPEREQRRSGRFSVVVPIEVKWQAPDGATFRENAEALEVNLHGALVRMKTPPPVGTSLELTNRVSGEVVPARAVALRGSRLMEVAIEIITPSETFWGVTFRLKKTTSDLRVLEEDIKSGGADPRVLREFRDAVDYIRKTAWVVYEWQERQLKHKDASTVLSLLLTERLRRATQLNDAIVANLDAGELPLETPRIAELLSSAERLVQHLRSLRNDAGGV
jgi:hypothetical protein